MCSRPLIKLAFIPQNKKPQHISANHKIIKNQLKSWQSTFDHKNFPNWNNQTNNSYPQNSENPKFKQQTT
ncbi:hypothetical protein AHAS_Ahas16G0257200 [Arachis hypogaea]